MQPRFLIIFAILGIIALAIFNFISSNHTQEVIAANQANTASVTVSTAAPALGEQPKAMLDKANAGINQANTDATNKLANAEKATQ